MAEHKGHKFDKSPQDLNDKKSQGMIEARKQKNLIMTARTLYESAEILPKLIDNIKEEVDNGLNKNAIELFKVLKEPEENTINLNGNVGVKKIYVTPELRRKKKIYQILFILSIFLYTPSINL